MQSSTIPCSKNEKRLKGSMSEIKGGGQGVVIANNGSVTVHF